jgi:SNF2 family DNA or RNA helicase
MGVVDWAQNGMKLRDYQETAADFLYEHDRAMILAPVGAGKTAITLTAMQAILKDGYAIRFLVLAPKRVCTDVWPVEQPKWAPGCTLAVAVGTPAQRKAALYSGAQIIVSNYDNIQWLAEQNLAHINAIVFDELTKLKNPSGARFKALNKVIGDVGIRWGLTGSFTSNGLEDVFGQCKIVDQTLLGRAKGAFMQQYFTLVNKDYGDWQPRKGSLELVMQRIKPATFVLEPGEYKDKLPPLHTVEVACKMDMADYNKMKKDFVLDDVVAVNAAVVTQKLQQMSSGFLYSDNGPIWLSPHKFDRLEELLDENQHANTIIFYSYQEELAELRRRYPHLQTLDDPNAIARWNKGEIELLVAHPASAQFGLNLQFGGNKMVFLSLPWSLINFEQAVGRLHRSGQKNPVWVYVFLTDKTIDEKIWRGLHDKLSLSQIALEALK